ncbi:MAG TPA: hypothetical protein VFH46_15945 [Pyrinomonadaceae bacterium]|nr:hypothetical protein [Pyrinomonadaceae bacterium]
MPQSHRGNSFVVQLSWGKFPKIAWKLAQITRLLHGRSSFITLTQGTFLARSRPGVSNNHEDTWPPHEEAAH